MRELLGWTQGEVAEETGISPSALSQAERGDTTLSAIQHRLGSQIVSWRCSPEAFVEQPAATCGPRASVPASAPYAQASSSAKAEQLVYATAQVVNVLKKSVEFPKTVRLRGSSHVSILT